MSTSSHFQVMFGIDHFCENHLHLIESRRVGFVTNQTATDNQCVPSVDRLTQSAPGAVTALFGPEHGVRGEAQAGEKVADAVDAATGIPLYSLYGETKKPTAAMLENVDVLLVDVPDIGCRYYTNMYTMAYVLQAGKKHDIPVIVLDRPNPITGIHAEGNVVQPGFTSFVGGYPITNRTGITIGEAARLFNEHHGIDADLHVIPAKGWRRHMWFDETGLPWVMPSPNMPALDTAILYPGTCFIEGTNLSEGRGTTKPFEWIGAPWIDAYRLAQELNARGLPGVAFRPVYFTPTFQKHEGQLCAGVQVHVMERDQLQPVRLGLHLLHALYYHDDEHFQWLRFGSRPFIDLLAGNDTLRGDIEKGRDPDDLWHEWNSQNTPYVKQRENVLLYD